MSFSLRLLPEAWRLPNIISRSASFSEGTNVCESRKLGQSYSVGDSADKLSSTLQLLSAFDKSQPKDNFGSLPNLQYIPVLESPCTESEENSISHIEPGFNIDTFLNQLPFLSPRSNSPYPVEVPYVVARPLLVLSDNISESESIENESEISIKIQISEGTSQSVQQEDTDNDSLPHLDEEEQSGEEEDQIPEIDQELIPAPMAQQLQLIQGFAPKPIDTTALKRYAFPGNRLSSMMITRYINIPYFIVGPNDTTVTRGVVLNLYAKGRCILEKWSPTASQRTVAALEAIAPNLPNSCFASIEDSRLYLALSFFHHLSRNGPTSNYHRRENWPGVTINNAIHTKCKSSK